MSREQLLQIANNFIAWANGPPDATVLGTLLSQDVNVFIPYPGAAPGFAGTLELFEKLHTALPGIKFTITQSFVDEAESKVVLLFRTVGVQSGYVFL
jgi:hypothetical protein